MMKIRLEKRHHKWNFAITRGPHDPHIYTMGRHDRYEDAVRDIVEFIYIYIGVKCEDSFLIPKGVRR